MDIIPLYKLFTVSKNKSDIKGFWKDGKKIYIDNINIQDFTLINLCHFKIKKALLFIEGEKAVFYINHMGQGIIEDLKGNKTILNRKKAYTKKRLEASFIKELLNNFGGCTVYREAQGYRVEAFY